MMYDATPLHAMLHEAVGDDDALIAELRRGFLAAAAAQIDAMRDPGGWAEAASRLHGLAASFAAGELIAAAKAAARAPAGDAAVLAGLRALVDAYGE